MKKRWTKKAQREKIAELNVQISELRSKLYDAESEAERYKKRFKTLMFSEEMEPIRIPNTVGVVTANIEHIPYGMFITYDPEKAVHIDTLKERLAIELARGMIDADMVKFIIRDEERWCTGYATIGAKLYVIPWEQLTERSWQVRAYMEGRREI